MLRIQGGGPSLKWIPSKINMLLYIGPNLSFASEGFWIAVKRNFVSQKKKKKEAILPSMPNC